MQTIVLKAEVSFPGMGRLGYHEPSHSTIHRCRVDELNHGREESKSLSQPSNYQRVHR
jgi:hypothetical protein